MTLSARRLLALVAAAALGGGAAQAVAATGGTAHATTKAKKKKAKRNDRARAVKVGTGTGWVPPSALTGRPPLTGGGAGGGTATGGATTTGPVTTTGPGTTTTTPTSTDPPSLQAVGVTLDDRGGYTALLSRASVAAGAVVVQLINKGEDPHNLRVVPTDHAGATVDFPDTGPGANTTKTLTLTAGTYRVFCTLTTPVNHEAAGMHATLTVTP
ncbi:MAG TPA: plastocyanin/azurin family copper-binding protein [Baekduia sp.]|nr:plastocyanin/azurin family copper-binding protein [Baekduia sp.]